MGEYKTAGQEWRPKRTPELVRVHDFPDKRLGKALPYGIYEVIVDLIGNTTTKTGLTVRAALDDRPYETKIKVRDEELAPVESVRAAFHGDWNYTIRHYKK